MKYDFEDRMEKNEKRCSTCRWWEYDRTIATRHGNRLRIGICQTTDEERNERRSCAGWRKTINDHA